MCRCTPEIRTPFCGKPGCEWPKQTRVQNMIHEMIEAILKVGKKPGEIVLSAKDYDDLIDELDAYYDQGIEMTEVGAVYHSRKRAKDVDAIFGLPIHKGNEYQDSRIYFKVVANTEVES